MSRLPTPDAAVERADEPAASDRSRLKAARTDSLLKEAARLFARKGYRGVSIEELAAAVGVSGPALYRHFSNKQAILAEVLADVSQRLLDGARARVAAASSADEALRSLVDFHADFALYETDRIRVHNRDLSTLDDEAAAGIRAAQREYVELWVDQLAALELARASSDAAVAVASDVLGAGSSAATVLADAGLDRELVRLKVQAAIGLLNSTPHSVRHGDPDEVKPVLVRMTLAALLS